MVPAGRKRTLAAVCAAATLLFWGCRDEQAGPKHRRPPSAPAAAQQQAQGRVLQAAPQDLTFRSGATWSNGAIRYLGAKVEPQNARPGDRVKVTHYFVALQQPPSGWGFFVHLVDPSTGGMLQNVDHEIQGGAMPLERWPVGRVVVDEHEVTVPQGPSRILLGFWQGDARLPVDDPRSQDGSGRVLGPIISGDSQPALPEYHVKKTPRPPKIDGDTSDPMWSDATPVVLTGSFDGRKAALKTEARILYDAQYLYVAFDCEDPDVWGTLLNRDDPIYGQEVVEIFLDADANLATYNELEVSPNNVQFDAYFPARRQGMDLSWDAKMTSAVKVKGTLNDPSDRDEGWSVEMRIPYSTLAAVPHAPPNPGDRWRFNLYRLDLPDRRTQQGQSFSPLFLGDFHNLPRFGWLVFD